MSTIFPSKLVRNLRDKFQFEEKAFFEDQLNKKEEALIIVDIQNDFLPGGALAVPEGDEIIPIINALQKEFELIVLTQDWHPPGHKSFASAHPGQLPYTAIELNGADQVLWPDHCVQDTNGAAFASSLESKKASLIIRKGTDPEIDSYSGFFDNRKLKSTGLAGYLIEKGVKKVSVCGLAADFCVYFTALDALELGFEVEIIGNATKAINPVEYKNKLADLKSKGVKERIFSLP